MSEVNSRSQFPQLPGVKKTTVATTTGKNWSGTRDVLTTNVNGEAMYVYPKKAVQSKRIVLLGSSTTEDTGASVIANGYTSLLSTALTAAGYTIIKRGASGTKTADAIARFHKDVATTQPDFVIIQFTIGNEGLNNAAPDKDAVYQQFRKNILALANMCYQIGALPIIANQFPTTFYNAEIYSYANQLNAEFDAMGFHVLDFCGAIDDLTGQPLAAANFDGTHVNDTGHRALFKSIPLNLFENACIQDGRLLYSDAKGCLNTGNNAAAYAFYYTPEYTLESFTTFLRFRIPSAPASATALVGFDAGGALRLTIKPDGTLYLYANATNIDLPTQYVATDNQWHSVAISYNRVDDSVRVYFDGVLATTTTVAVATLGLTIGGRNGGSTQIKNGDFKDVVVYRSRQSDAKIKQLHRGVVTQTSLELFAPLNDQFTHAGARLCNLAATTGNLRISGSVTTITSNV